MLNLLTLKQGIDRLANGVDSVALIPVDDNGTYKMVNLSDALKGWFIIGDDAQKMPEDIHQGFAIVKAPEPAAEPAAPAPAAAAPEVPAPKKRTGGHRGGRKLNLDLGKIKALREAGRSIHWIADEMGCSDQTIMKVLKQMKQRDEAAAEPKKEESHGTEGSAEEDW